MMISVQFQRNRAIPGTLQVIDFGRVLIELPCLGKADNQEAARRGNPTRDPTQPFGDTPTGSYHAMPFRWPTPPPLADRKKYGPHGWIALDPISGQALTAKQNGRHGLLIHSGELRAGNLRPTFGCIRVTDEAMGQLLDLVTGPVDCTVS